MRVAFFKLLEDMFARDDKIVLILGDLGVYTAKNLFRDYPDRVFNIGICEQATVSLAAGLAKEGLKPIFYSIAPFAVERCLEQIKIDIGYQNIPVSIVSIGGSYDYAALGCTHHCPADVELIMTIPNMNIIAPSSAETMEQWFIYMHGYAPLYMRLSEISCDNASSNPIRYWENNVVFCYGTMADVVTEACEGMDVYVHICDTLFMMDSPFLNPKKIAIVEPWYEGTVLKEKIKVYPKSEIMSIGVPRRFLTNYGTKEQHDKACGLDVDSIRTKLKTFFND